jgi:regulator of sirC expression with transglutaminase-like and TPR domain
LADHTSGEGALFRTSGRPAEDRPRQAAALLDRSQVRTAPRDAGGALLDLDEAIQLKPDYAKAIVNRGSARLQLRDTRGARSDLEAAQEILKRK